MADGVPKKEAEKKFHDLAEAYEVREGLAPVLPVHRERTAFAGGRMLQTCGLLS